MTRALLAAALLSTVACGGSGPAAQPPPSAPSSATPAPGPADDEGLWERCKRSVETRCAAANPGGGAGEQSCRDKAAARYARIKTQGARREYLLGLGCRPADAG